MKILMPLQNSHRATCVNINDGHKCWGGFTAPDATYCHLNPGAKSAPTHFIGATRIVGKARIFVCAESMISI